MRLTIRKIATFFLVVYLLISCYTGYVLFRKIIWDPAQEGKEKEKDDKDWNPWGFEFEGGPKPENFEKPQVAWKYAIPNSEDTKPRPGDHIVEIWGKAAIGLYLWEHIFDAKLNDRDSGSWKYGAVRRSNIIFRFRTGPGVAPSTVPQDVENLVLVLNGRETSKIEAAVMWLDYVDKLLQLKNLAVVLLGNEQCNNDWIHRYMYKNGGPVKFVFLVYDSPEIDDFTFYQWPLGVATYRDFPLVRKSDIEVDSEREYTCNFLGTIYANTSREQLLKLIHSQKLEKKHCLVKARMKWLPQETDDTREDFVHALAQSDLTLNPVGVNTECYRIYEALSFGSVPVIENKMTKGRCGNSTILRNAPLRLLKKYSAPFIYISDWRELPKLIDEEQERSLEDVVRRRKYLLLWYEDFKKKMMDKFVSVIQLRFFNHKR